MLLETTHERFSVQARITGRVEPHDGRYHFGGRIAPDDRVAALVRGGVREVLLDGHPVRLIEIDPWGGVLVRGVST